MIKKLFTLALILVFSATYAQQSQHPDSLIQFYKDQAWVLKQSDAKLATTYLHRGLSLALAQKTKDEIDIGYFYRKLISQKGYSGQLDSVSYFFKKGMAYYSTVKKSVDGLLPAHLHSEMGEVYHRNANNKLAKYHYKKSDTLYRAANDSIGVAIINLNLGNIYYVEGNYPAAIQNYIDGVKMAETTEYTYIKGNIFNSISAAYGQMGDYKNAKQYGEEFLKIARVDKNSYPEYFVIALNNLANKETKLANYKKANQYLEEAAAFIKDKNLIGLQASVNKAKADILIAQNKYSEAIILLEETKPLLEQYKTNTEEVFEYNYVLAKAYKQNGEGTKAFTIFKNIESRADSLKMMVETAYINEALAEMYFNNGDPKNAYLAQIKSKKISDSLFTLDKQKVFKDIEAKYQTAEKEKILAETRANLAERELQVKRKNILIYGSFGFALLLGLIGYLFYNQQKLKNNQLTKENELKTALAKIETQNQLQEQRLRISRDLHDNIGSQLTFVISSIDSLKLRLKDAGSAVTDKLGTISNFASNTVYELRDTIWAMNKTEISIEDLQGRIANFIEKAMVSNENVNFNFVVSEEISTENSFTSVDGMNMYRIIQEAVNNSLKYSEATHIEVYFGKKELKITDNGKGFDPNKVEKGNGLYNIQKRAKDLGAILIINSEIGKGTVVSVAKE